MTTEPGPAVPYLSGLDGLRAVAVMAVMIYHANTDWLPGGFLGVEVFFVVSGYIITLLLVTERERTGAIALKAFWIRRARRLLPALGVLLVGVTVYTALFKPDAIGRLRGDVFAGLAYVSNWFQIAQDSGYEANGDFAPLRHLWSLAVEEQFYLVWPVVILLLLRRRTQLLTIAVVLAVVAGVVALVVAQLHYSGPIGTCASTPGAYWEVGDRCISKTNALYLSTVSRSTGLLLGAAFAMVWRPGQPSRRSDVAGLSGLVVIGWLVLTVSLIGPNGASDFLFREGFLLTDVATLAVIAAVASGSLTNRILSQPPLLWIGTRSYGLYLFHWPIYQAIRGVTGNSLSAIELTTALTITALVAELSYRYIEMPVRRGTFVAGLTSWSRSPLARTTLASTAVVGLALSGFGVVRLVTEPVRPNSLEEAFAAGAQETTSLAQLLASSPAPLRSTQTTVAPTDAEVTNASGGGGPPHPPPPTTAPSPTTTTPRASAIAPSSTTPTTIAPATTTTTAPVVTLTIAPSTTTTTTTTPSPTTTTTTTVPAPSNPSMLALGDSVLVGAAPDLVEAGWVVNADIGRQTWDLTPVVHQLAAADAFGDVVAINIGTNGAITNAQLDDWLSHLSGVRRVILVTIRGDRSWIPPNNQKLRERAGGNVVVLDWAAQSNSCPGRCFDVDGIHLFGAGRRLLTDLMTSLATAQPAS